jgi:hypothetical protein
MALKYLIRLINLPYSSSDKKLGILSFEERFFHLPFVVYIILLDILMHYDGHGLARLRKKERAIFPASDKFTYYRAKKSVNQEFSMGKIMRNKLVSE